MTTTPRKLFEQLDSQNQNNNCANLKDLCPEDKARVGDLVKKLAEEREKNEELINIIEKLNET
jgi:hypothetical protein